MGSRDFFPSADHAVPQLFLIAVYGFILFTASKTISAGSEMLLCLYGPGIIGGLLIPILGAVPDSAIILVSGLGSGTPEQIQDQLNIGVGTLAGSTIMLLTLPWAAGVLLGARDKADDGTAASERDPSTGKMKPKFTRLSLTNSVVTAEENVPLFAKVMMFTTISYLIIQIPAFTFSKDTTSEAIERERPYALAGFIITLVFLMAYCAYQLIDARHDQLVTEFQREAERARWRDSLATRFSNVDALGDVFREFDKDKSGYLERMELLSALRTLGLQADRQEVASILEKMDADKDGRISESEFTNLFAKWIGMHSQKQLALARRASVMPAAHMAGPSLSAQSDSVVSSSQPMQEASGMAPVSIEEATPTTAMLNGGGSEAGDEEAGRAASGGDDDGDEEEEEEEELAELTDTQIRIKAFTLLLIGTALVVLFSDPMVEVINDFGNTIGIPPFYISFLITPMASNASEVISGLVFARRKTSRGISLTFSSLYGAATMNNTLGLSIFMALVYFRHLKWNFSSEVISILFVSFGVGLNALRRTVHLWQAVLVALLFPLSLVLVAVLEKAGLQ